MLDMTGTSTNSGDVSVTNVVVVNNQPANNTPVITVSRLEPGEGRSFSGSYAIPSNVCSVSDTLTATATDLCGRSTNRSEERRVGKETRPGLAPTKNSPDTNGLPGGVLGFMLILADDGIRALSVAGVQTYAPPIYTPVITVPRLEPGEGRSFTGSYAIPSNVCSVSDTLTATATDLCGRSTNATISATCPVLTTPGLALTKTCPATNGLPGGVLGFTGTITNTGNVGVA